MKVKFYGGPRAVGGNCVLLESSDGQTRILIDIGTCFDAEGRYFEAYLQPRAFNELRDLLCLGLVPSIPGIYAHDMLHTDREGTLDHLKSSYPTYAPDLVADLWDAPNIQSCKDYKAQHGRPFVQGVFISHAHQDHYGYVRFLDADLPLFMSSVTLAYLRAERDMGARKKYIDSTERASEPVKQGRFKGAPRVQVHDLVERPVTVVDSDHPVTIGPFKVQAWEIDHSIAGGLAFLVTDTSDNTTFVYASDFRFHGPRGDRTRVFQDALTKLDPPVDGFVCEGTRIAEDTAVPEADVQREMIRIFKGAQGLIVVSFPWKNVYRFQSTIAATREVGRTLVISPKLAYLAHKLAQVAPDLNIETVGIKPDLKVFVSRSMSGLYHPYEYSWKGNTYQAGTEFEWNLDDPENKKRALLFLDNGIFPWDFRAHPEKYVLHLNYYDCNDLVDIAPPGGFCDGTFVESAADAEDLEEEPGEQRFRNWLETFGILKPEEPIIYVHGSGHASGPEVRALLAAARPRAVFPVHTEHPELYAQGDAYHVVADLLVGECFCITRTNWGQVPSNALQTSPLEPQQIEPREIASPQVSPLSNVAPVKKVRKKGAKPVQAPKVEKVASEVPIQASAPQPEVLPSKVTPEFDAVFALGFSHFNAGDLILAAENFERATRLDPKSVDAWYNLGVVLDAQEDYARSATVYEKVVELDPRHVAAWQNLGAARKDLGDAAGAEQAYRRSLDLDPKNGVVWYELAETLRVQGKREAAAEASNKSVECEYFPYARKDGEVVPKQAAKKRTKKMPKSGIDAFFPQKTL